MKRLERDHRDYGRAVRIGYYTVMLFESFRIYFGNYERCIFIHSPGGGIIDHKAASFDSLRGEYPAHLIGNCKERDIDTLKSLITGKLDLYVASLEGQLCPYVLLNIKQFEFLDRKRPLLQRLPQPLLQRRK